MNQSAVRTGYHSIVISQWLYAAPAWCGFSSTLLVLLTVECVAASVQLITPTFPEMVDKLFHKILNDTSHVLSQLLPEHRNELTYSLRTRWHDRTLSQGATRVTDNNFITRQRFKNSY